MRKITEIIIHCTATPRGRVHTVEDIDRWHRRQGYDGIGYHYVILLDGTVRLGRPLEKAGAHCKGHNAHSIGIAYVGGLDLQGRPANTLTPPQRAALLELTATLSRIYTTARVRGHCELNPAKACPCLDMEAFRNTVTEKVLYGREPINYF